MVAKSKVKMGGNEVALLSRGGSRGGFRGNCENGGFLFIR